MSDADIYKTTCLQFPPLLVLHVLRKLLGERGETLCSVLKLLCSLAYSLVKRWLASEAVLSKYTDAEKKTE